MSAISVVSRLPCIRKLPSEVFKNVAPLIAMLYVTSLRSEIDLQAHQANPVKNRQKSYLMAILKERSDFLIINRLKKGFQNKNRINFECYRMLTIYYNYHNR